jgi:hypothetical protein
MVKKIRREIKARQRALFHDGHIRKGMGRKLTLWRAFIITAANKGGSMSNDKKHLTFTKVALIIVACVILIGVALVGVDYKSYKKGDRSHLFGTLNTYKQTQTLKFGNLNLKVTEATIKPYPQPTPPAQTRCNNPVLGSSTFIADFDCQSHLSNYQNQLTRYHNKHNLVVTFSYSNISVQPISLAKYRAKILANTILTTQPNNCSGLPSPELLKGSPQSGCFSMDIDKGYRGPLTLSITSNGIEKDINPITPQ